MTISVVIPVYNGEAFLAEAIESVLGQSRKPLEIIVVDDGSSDASPDIAARYASSIRYLLQENQGPYAARNFGVRHCQGEAISFLDSDDIWHQEKLQRQAACLEADPNLNLVYCAYENFLQPPLQTDDPEILKAKPGYQPAFALVRKRLFDRGAWFDDSPNHAAGLNWLLQLLEEGERAEMVRQTLVHRRIHGDNYSLKRAERSRNDFLLVVKASLDRRRRQGSLQPYQVPGL